MREFLIGLMYHYPEDYELWKKGVMEDYEASTGIFINAENLNEALEWGRTIAENLLNFVNNSEHLTLDQFQHDCWHVPDPQRDSWSHCLSFFQHVAVGEMPELEKMTTNAFVQWQKNNA